MRDSGSAWSTTSPPATSPTWPTSRVASSGSRGASRISRSAAGPRKAWIMSSTRRRSRACRVRSGNRFASHESGPTATINMLEAARLAGVRRFMFAASSSAYGDTIELPKHEDMLPQPLSPYAAGKLAGEHYVRVYAQTMGLDGVSLRYFNIFGPRQDPSSPYSGVISIFIKTMSQGQRPTIYGDGTANPRLYLCGQCRGRQPRRDAASGTAGRGRVQRRVRPEYSTPRPGRGAEHDFRDGSRTRVPACPRRRRPRLAGQPGPNQPGPRLSAARFISRGA